MNHLSNTSTQLTGVKNLLRSLRKSHRNEGSSDEKARQIITELMNDKDLYKKMSKKEGEIWGKVFTDDKRKHAVEADQQAAQELDINRHKFSLMQVLNKHSYKPQTGLSLACGSGRAERGLMQAGICSSFHAIDIADSALNEARKLAKQQTLNITYEKADLNELQLDRNAYDLVVTQNCLHHVLHLENLAEQIHLSLRTNGLLWIHDYIGETQFQYDNERLNIVNEILSILPKKYRFNSVTKRTIDKVIRREPGTLISPFEAIRSADIMPVFLERFKVIEKHESASILHLVCPVGTRGNFTNTEEGKLLFEILFMLDKLLIEKDVCSPQGGIYLLQAK
ncbi:MAG TPA: class I SAM-dependent methyltransferase [Crenotrichaceae bacterium]|nr:class I SAM-dependent methyltransferase [Crenotrichaceae bacterium]